MPQVAQCAPQRRKKKNRKKPEIPVSVWDMALDDFVELLVDSDVRISSDALWDAIDTVVPSGGATAGASRYILDRHLS